MKQQLEQRLKALRLEYEQGNQMLSEQEAKQATLRGTLLRISGAIQVLEEELGKTDPEPGAPATGAAAASGGDRSLT